MHHHQTMFEKDKNLPLLTHAPCTHSHKVIYIPFMWSTNGIAKVRQLLFIDIRSLVIDIS